MQIVLVLFIQPFFVAHTALKILIYCFIKEVWPVFYQSILNIVPGKSLVSCVSNVLFPRCIHPKLQLAFNVLKQ